ncbi:MAG TPA: hypothetical protein VJO14_07755 [Bacteroidota bacterium]|nr:hypothetical protein [Bacteroidota bacterium]
MTPRPLSRILPAFLAMMLSSTISPAQYFSSGRGIATGAYTGVVSDLGALDWNPAGLTSIRDWELSTANFFQFHAGEQNLTFHHAAAGKRFLSDHAAAVRVSPGIRLDLIVPSTFTVEDSNATIMTQFDKEITYTEQFALGYAFRAADYLSLGFSAHFLEEKVTTTEYSIDSSNVITSSPLVRRGNSWSVDWGVMWDPAPAWRLGAVAKNLFRITESSVPEEMNSFRLNLPKTVRAGASFTGLAGFNFSADTDFENRLRAGTDWDITRFLNAAAGMYFNANSGFSAEAAGAGVFYSVANVDIMLSGIFFTDQTSRRGSADLALFEGAGVDEIEYTRFTGDRASLSLTLNLGRTRDPIAKIEYVEMLTDIYPSSSRVYAFRPVGRARIRNESDSPIEARVSFNIERYMDVPTESRPQVIGPGETAEVPFFAVLNSAVQGLRTMVVREGEVSVSAVRTGESEDTYAAHVLLRGKNDWNGDVTLLKYFVTPDDPDILNFTRSVLNDRAPELDTTDARMRNFERARVLFDALAGRLLYVNDPRGSQDNVQYPSETLSLKGGDCDDMSVLYSSMLASIGIRTAFIDVVPPERPDSAHIFMMFDTGIPSEDAALVGDNSKRYVIRNGRDRINGEGNVNTLWIPVETTLTRRGFDRAWTDGADQYYRDVEVELGLMRGWVRVVDQGLDF